MNYNPMENKKRFFSKKHILKSLILAIIFWFLLPIRFCFNVYPDFTGETVRVCEWFTFGFSLISDIYYQGWENYLIIIVLVELFLLFIISFIIIKLLEVLKKKLTTHSN